MRKAGSMKATGTGWILQIGIGLISTIFFFSAPGLAQGSKPLTNDDIIQMVKAGFSDETITKAIESSECNFDVSLQGLLGLKFGGVSEKVINAMLSASNRKNEPDRKATASEAADLPQEVGVYIRKQGKLVEMQPEIVNWRTGGFLKSMATMGVTKGHVNGSVNDPRSAVRIGVPIEFVIRCVEGTSAAEYQLLKLDEKKDRREFRALTGGIIHASGGADKNAVAFKFEKIATATYVVTVPDLAPGEYGFLPPGVASASVASSGKIYTFAVSGKQ